MGCVEKVKRNFRFVKQIFRDRSSLLVRRDQRLRSYQQFADRAKAPRVTFSIDIEDTPDLDFH